MISWDYRLPDGSYIYINAATRKIADRIGDELVQHDPRFNRNAGRDAHQITTTPQRPRSAPMPDSFYKGISPEYRSSPRWNDPLALAHDREVADAQAQENEWFARGAHRLDQARGFVGKFVPPFRDPRVAAPLKAAEWAARRDATRKREQRRLLDRRLQERGGQPGGEAGDISLW